MENVKHLQELINYTGTASETDLLTNILNYARKKLTCGGGSAFSFDNATHRLMLKASTWHIEKPFSLPMGKGAAGIAAKTPNQYTLFFGETLTNVVIPHDYAPQEGLVAIVAMPVSNFDVPEVVFCFDIYKQDLASNRVQDLTPDGLGPKIHNFWQELREIYTRAAIHRIRMHRIPRKIYEAGLAAGNVTKEVASFITRFQKELVDTYKAEKPDFIYVQLVDPMQNLVRTIQGVGAIQGLQVISAHTLSEDGGPPDINVDVIKSRRVEIISGGDKRFDPYVHQRYGHENYIRIWLPLFPFPVSDTALWRSADLRDYVQKHLLWQTHRSSDRDQSIHQSAEWTHGTTPPSELIYGVLEVGYTLDKPAARKLSHSDHDLAAAIISVALEISEDLYHSTIPGVLDRIGRLSANVPAFKKTVFTFFDPNRKRSEKRTYPELGFWQCAVPAIEESVDLDIFSFRRENGPNRILDGKKIKIECDAKKKDDFPETAPNIPEEKLSGQYCEDVREQNEKAAITAINTAFQLHKAAMTPFELMEQRTDKKNVGTFRKDICIQAFVEDIARSYGTMFVFYQDFRIIYKAGERMPKDLEGRPEHMHPAEALPEELQNRLTIDDLKKMAKKTAHDRVPIHHNKYIIDDKKSYALSLLPLELSEGSIGVLTIIFQNGVPLDEELRRGLEGQAPYWSYRLSMHRLSLHRRFTRMMYQFRQDIAQAGSDAENTKGGQDPSQKFLTEVLKIALTHLKANAAIITRNVGHTRDLDRIDHYWCFRNKTGELQTNSIELFKHDFILSYLNNKLKQDFDLISGPQSQKHAQKIRNALLNESKNYISTNQSADAHKLDELATVFNIIEPKDSIVNLFIQNSYSGTAEESIKEESTFSFIMPQAHYFDSNQQQMVKELGTLIRHTMARVQSKQRECLWEKLIGQTNMRLQQFETAKSIDELVGFFFKGLGEWSLNKKEGGGLNKNDYIGAADTAIFWTLSRTYDELVARSVRGDGLGSFDSPIDVIPPEKHPFLYEERRHIVKRMKKYRYPIYKNEFELLTFDLSSVSEKDKSKSVKQAYNQRANAKWMISFPLVDGANRLSGVVDLLRDKPFSPVEETVYREVFVRLSRRLNAAAERVNLQKVKTLTDKLFFITRNNIKEFKISTIYQDLVEEIKKTFRCKNCDLFVEKGDRYVLYASTHAGPKTERERDQFYVMKPDQPIKNEDILMSCVQTKQSSASHTFDFGRQRDEHYSPKLWQHLKGIGDNERLVLPIRLLKESEQDKPTGLFQLHGLNETIETGKTSGDKKLKKNLRFSIEDYMVGRDIGLALSRIIKIVELAEQQIWLVRELGHSLGQPLEVLRANANKCLRALNRSNSSAGETTSLSGGINMGFDLVHDALNQLTYFHGVNAFSVRFEMQDLAQQVKKCCDSMAEIARSHKVRIDYSEVWSIQPIPFDMGWMRIIVLNLLHNACKYSWAGMTVAVSLKEIDGIIHLKVANSGIGIPDNERDHIFELYFRSRIPDRRGVRPGTGIGLFIVKNGVEVAHGGHISVASNPTNEKDRKLIQKTGKIENYLYRTCFTILLYREKLNGQKDDNQSANGQHEQSTDK